MFKTKVFRNKIFGLIAQVVAGWSPQTQGTLVNWYDASILGLSNGATVVTWPDSKTGNPNPMTSAGSFNPTYQTNQQNGLGTVNFNGSQVLETGGSSGSTFPYTVAVVFYIPNYNSGTDFLATAIPEGLEFGYVGTTGIGVVASNAGNIGFTTSAIGAGSYHLLILTVDASNYAFYVDGVAIGSGTHSIALQAGTTFVIGGRTFAANPNAGLLGNMGEIQIYSSILGGTDLANLHTYIKNKWGTP